MASCGYLDFWVQPRFTTRHRSSSRKKSEKEPKTKPFDSFHESAKGPLTDEKPRLNN
jgi:hypothetical protein